MIVMPCYGVKMDKFFVQKPQLLKNNITSCNSDFNECFLNGKDFNKNNYSKEVNSIKSKMKSVLEVLIKEQNQMICQNLFMNKKSFLLQL